MVVRGVVEVTNVVGLDKVNGTGSPPSESLGVLVFSGQGPNGDEAEMIVVPWGGIDCVRVNGFCLLSIEQETGDGTQDDEITYHGQGIGDT